MKLDDKLNFLLKKHADLSDKLLDPQKYTQKEFMEMSKEFSYLEEIKLPIDKYFKLCSNIKECKEMIDSEDLDAEMLDLIKTEIDSDTKQLPDLEQELQMLLLPRDKADEKNAIIEIRAGTGGDEAALFASNLLSMYLKYAESQGWKAEILSKSETELAGYKEVSVLISGNSVYKNMKFESGVHRVQRVPETESQGRVHTSAATVAVLPQAEDVDIEIEEKDLRIDLFRASGAGGQHVNTTDSAVRITHLPTNTVVSIQDEKSQHKNKAKAMKILRSRIYENQRQNEMSERSAMRKGMIGSGDRSERIRTYNFPQNRLTDHRINLTLYKLDLIVSEGDLSEVINALLTEDRIQKMKEVE